MDNVMMDGFLGLVGTGAYTVGLWTLYEGLWKTREEKLMNTLVEKFNQEALESVPFPEPMAPLASTSDAFCTTGSLRCGGFSLSLLRSSITK